MDELLRSHPPEQPQPEPVAPDPGGGPGAETLAAAGRNFLAIAGDAIDRVLSHDSQAFNHALRQQGGQ